MEYIIYDGQLYHHGVKGMKWGVKRYRNADGSLTDAGRKRQARVYSKELNRLDKEYVKNTARAMRYEQSKNKKHLSKPYRDSAAKIDSDSWKAIGKIASEGYNVRVKQITRDGERGRTIVTGLLGGGLGTALVTSIRVPKYMGKYRYEDKRGQIRDQYPWAVQGNKYKVTN